VFSVRLENEDQQRGWLRPFRHVQASIRRWYRPRHRGIRHHLPVGARAGDPGDRRELQQPGEKVYDVEEIELQNGDKAKLKPLSIKQLRKFMEVVKKTQDSTDENVTLSILIDACAVALETQLPDLVSDRDKLEDALDVPTINRILEVCGGIKMDDPNLIAAAVLAGQN